MVRMKKDDDWGVGVLLTAGLVVGFFAGAFILVFNPISFYPQDTVMASGDVRVVEVDVYNWGFDPEEIVVTEGETIVLVIRNVVVYTELQAMYQDEEDAYLATKSQATRDAFYACVNCSVHSFTISGLDLDIHLGDTPETASATYVFVAGEAGEYRVRCSEYCGPGHKAMKGKFIILAADDTLDDTNTTTNGGV